MPKVLKNSTITLLDSGIESYIIALYSMATPSLRKLHKAESKQAPVVGLLGAAAELLVKACLVQAKGMDSMYREGNISSGIYRFGSEVIEELRRYIRDEDDCISYIWGNSDDHTDQKQDSFTILESLNYTKNYVQMVCTQDLAALEI